MYVHVDWSTTKKRLQVAIAMYNLYDVTWQHKD